MKRIGVDDFPWEEFLKIRKKAIVWFRRYGNEGEKLSWGDVAKVLSLDPEQTHLIFMGAEEEGL